MKKCPICGKPAGHRVTCGSVECMVSLRRNYNREYFQKYLKKTTRTNKRRQVTGV